MCVDACAFVCIWRPEISLHVCTEDACSRVCNSCAFVCVWSQRSILSVVPQEPSTFFFFFDRVFHGPLTCHLG